MSIRYKKYKQTYKNYHDKINFSGLREKVIERDGGKCVTCGLTRQENYDKYGRDINVDHVFGEGIFDKNGGRRNKVELLQTLCQACHGAKSRKKVIHLYSPFKKGYTFIMPTEK